MSLGYYPFGYRPPFLWDVGASEQEITNVLEGVGGRGGYGSLSPPAMGYYGVAVDETQSKVLGSVIVCAGLLAVLGAGFWYMGKQMDKLERGEIGYKE